MLASLMELPSPALLLLVLLPILLWFWASPGKKSEKKAAAKAGGGSDTADAQTANFCRSLTAPEYPHEEGCFVPASDFLFNNMPTPVHFENDFAEGAFLSLHRATYDSELNKSGKYAYGSYFLGKKRLWEARVQFRFKKPPRVDDLYFGIELERYVPMNRATKRTMETVVSMLKKAVGSQIYHSPGDDPEKSSGELENPVFVMPLWAFDQFHVSKEGETPPDLADPAVSSMGSTRAKRVRKFKEELEKLEFKVGPTYTFCFWGISQWLDKLNWEIKMPFLGNLDFNQFCGAPPVHVVIYCLKQRGEEKRHLHSRKQYFFDLAFWSSRCRPPLERIQTLLKDTWQDGAPKEDGTDTFVKSLVDIKPRGWRLSCCGVR